MADIKITQKPIAESVSADDQVLVIQDDEGVPSLRRAVLGDLDVIEVDDTLTQSRKAADAKKVGDELTSLKGDLKYETLVDSDLWGESGYRSYNSTTGLIDVGTRTGSTRFRSAIVSVEPGEIYIFSGSTAGDYPTSIRLWAFTTINTGTTTPVSIAEPNLEVTDLAFIIPTGVSYLVINFDKTKPLKLNKIGILKEGLSKIDGTIRFDVSQSLTDAQKQTARNNIGVEEADTTLSVPGKAADAKITGDRISGIENALSYEDLVGSAGSSYGDSGFHYYNSSANKINGTTITGDAAYRSSVIPVEYGDMYIISGSAELDQRRLWIFVDSIENNVTPISVADANLTVNNLAITVPKGASYLIINYAKANGIKIYRISTFKTESAKANDRLDALEGHTLSVDEKLRVLNESFKIETIADSDPWAESGYRAYSAANNTITVGTRSGSTLYRSGIIPVESGESYLLNASTEGDVGTVRLWAFTSTNEGTTTPIKIAGIAEVANGLILNVPDGASYLVINYKRSAGIKLYRINIRSLIPELSDYNNTISVSGNSAGNHLVQADILAGHVYYIKNMSNVYTSCNVSTVMMSDTSTIVERANVSAIATGGEIIFIPKVDAECWRIYANNPLVLKIIDATTVNGRLYKQEKYSYPLVELQIDHTLKDVSSIVSEIDYTNVSSNTTIMQQIYSLFDGLVSSYPSIVTKTDLGEYCELAYPEYANGIETEGTYKVTPPYKTYMYKLSYANSFVNKPNVQRKTLLILGGVHGNELAAPFNTYIFAKNLLEMADSEYFKLLSAFDVYIVPCVNGYGMIHVLRVNANNVNINRNYPVSMWEVSGSGTADYTGPSAGSEFETQLVMKLTDKIRPDIAIDHHNYGGSSKFQYFAECGKEKWLPLFMQGLADCSYTFKKAYPNDFGSDFSLLQHQSGSAPGFMNYFGTANIWWGENGVPIDGTIEISYGVNYTNGTATGTLHDAYSAKAFSLAEYMLRNSVLRMANVVLRNAQ